MCYRCTCWQVLLPANSTEQQLRGAQSRVMETVSYGRYMWRHGYNTSFYQLAQQMASPATKATVLSTIINRNDSTFPTDADYFKIIQTCEPSGPSISCSGVTFRLMCELCYPGCYPNRSMSYISSSMP